MYILITRPENEATILKNQLSAMGLHCLVEPLFTVNFLDHCEQALASALSDHTKLIIATSKNSIRALSRLTNIRDIPIISVGDKTADLAYDLGFADIKAAGNTASSLAEYIIDNCTPDNTVIIYPSGRITSIDIKAILESRGFKVKQFIVYETLPLTSLSASISSAIQENKLTAALFYSKRTAEIFMDLVLNAGLQNNLANTIAFALSDKIANVLKEQTWQDIFVTKSPSNIAMLALLKMKLNNGTEYESATCTTNISK